MKMEPCTYGGYDFDWKTLNDICTLREMGKSIHNALKSTLR